MSELKAKKLIVEAKEYYDMRHELCEYHMLEQKLGIDLITYHKLMSKLYCGDGDKVFYKGKEAIIYEIDYCKKKVILLSPEDGKEIVVGFGGFGKTWAFTKEELK